MLAVKNIFGCDNSQYIKKEDQIAGFLAGVTLIALSILVYFGKCPPAALGITSICVGGMSLFYYAIANKQSEDYACWKFHLVTSLALVILGSLSLSGHFSLRSLVWANVGVGISRLIFCDMREIAVRKRDKTGDFERI